MDIVWDNQVKKIKKQIEICKAEDMDIPDDVIQLAEMLIETGDKNPEQRKNLMYAIKSMMKEYPRYQFFRGYPISAGHGL
tara:strand:+ start:1750 stop:1989 length:240 start_codon:yes stop_codon:yes gene_type:complete